MVLHDHKTMTPNFLILLFVLVFLSQTVKSEHPISSFLRLPNDGDSETGISQICPTESDLVDSCPVKCFRPDPVCGEDGVTYWCGCSDARCAGTRVVKSGFCEVGNGGSGQALLLVHIIWLIVVGFSLLCGFI